LTEQFLQTAIDYAHAKEQIEEEHVLQAHEEYESALHQEDSLRQMADEKWAVEQLAREQEEFREGVTDYVHEQIKLAQEKEAYAKQEEDEALDSLHSLQEREVRLKKTLEDFRDLQKERQETRKQMEQRGGAEDDYVAQRQHWEEEQRQKTNRFDSRGPPSRQKVSPSNSYGGGTRRISGGTRSMYQEADPCRTRVEMEEMPTIFEGWRSRLPPHLVTTTREMIILVEET